ncbi:hypothetical protein NST50_04070 [Paenibacillus sp. FSL E2-0202]|uniref:hypothetical protein n=1 Tax=Paenibacillus TaxID=44249 RepID=UPI00158B8C7B|nr:hypothetical protein [Paenibacillus odorifer]
MPTKLNALARPGLNTECACTNGVEYRICRQKRVEVEVEVEEGRSSRGTGQQK